MRAVWKGAVTFGLVNVPVKLYSATEDHDVSLHQVHDKDGGRIRYQRVCEIDGEVVPYQHIDKAYDDGERTVIITDQDLKALPAERSREIEVVEFVPTEQVDPIRFDKSYYLEPDSASNKAYVLLREALESTERTAIVRMALRQKTRLAALRVFGDVLMVQTLLWNDEVREAKFPSLDEKARISDKELELSKQLIESLSGDFDPEQFVDEYQQELRTLIKAKLEQGDAIDTAATFGEQPEKEEGGEVIDLMEALRQSIAAKRGGSDEKPAKASKSTAKSGSGAAAKPAAKSTAKSPAKKTASDGAAKPAARRKTTKKAG
ncbi:DNA end-binding protein Ku [Agromyces flavus]|uniref:Non-homologous end joining protein Ku n=1 Tax=Agromyces flavus TaxID=589382 RepID=A0A1H1Y3X9_9MICO|nr:Ku protein [Agromyces flavus]MCP2366575.1 DNA end-binding protein Ku [Agromyces flavus]GGI44948.1 non-homologous end joining protein Ku [Agromyces flavus]SDT15929.1 DNA end-binding protein Ku [Agromyces flavus]